MKKIFAIAMGALMVLATDVQAQDKKPASPPASVTQKLDSDVTITINYSQPSLKGRTIGENVEPMKNKVWRMGANKATVFETDRDILVEGQELGEGKYALFGVWEENGFRLIFNRNWDVWGTQYEKNRDADALSVVVQPRTTSTTQEQLTYTIDKSGKVTLLWGNMAVDFNVKPKGKS